MTEVQNTSGETVLQVPELMTDRELLVELVTSLRVIQGALANFDPMALLAPLLGGGSEPSPMVAILGSLIK